MGDTKRSNEQDEGILTAGTAAFIDRGESGESALHSGVTSEKLRKARMMVVLAYLIQDMYNARQSTRGTKAQVCICAKHRHLRSHPAEEG